MHNAINFASSNGPARAPISATLAGTSSVASGSTLPSHRHGSYHFPMLSTGQLVPFVVTANPTYTSTLCHGPRLTHEDEPAAVFNSRGTTLRDLAGFAGARR